MAPKRMKKRGMIEVQFNWILILVIGTLVIILFVRIAFTQKAMADQKLAVTLLNQLSLITSGAEVATSTASEIDVAYNKFSFECTEGDCKYKVTDLMGSTSPSYNKKAMFAPSLVQGQKIITWALDWNMPYKVTNFLFLTSPDIRYVFVHTLPLGQVPQQFNDIVQKLPDQIDNGRRLDDFYMISNLDTNFSYANEYMVRIVVYDPTAPGINITSSPNIKNVIANQLSTLNYKRITILKVTPLSGFDLGELEFYKLNKAREIVLDNSPTFYLGETSLIGAMLVDNYDNYVYPMESAYKRLNYVSDVYSARTQQLNTYYNNHPGFDPEQKCEQIYNSAYSLINDINGYTVPDFSSFTDDGNLINVYQRAFVVPGYPNPLQTLNNNAMLFSCPPIY